MPRNGKSSLIQQIANKANAMFRSCSSAEGKASSAQRSELSALLTELQATHLNISRPKKSSNTRSGSSSIAPVTYMHICETEAFSMGVFLLRAGASIPLHDHPGMNGMLKVLYGKVRIRCYDKLERPPNASEAGREGPSLCPSQCQSKCQPECQQQCQSPSQQAPIWPSVLRSTGDFTEHSGPCLLTPQRDNLHQIEAVEGPAAFLDILAPPYDPDDGRDCHYYRVIHGQSGQEEGETLLLEIPQPDDFWCGGEPYPGPQVAL